MCLSISSAIPTWRHIILNRNFLVSFLSFIFIAYHKVLINGRCGAHGTSHWFNFNILKAKRSPLHESSSILEVSGWFGSRAVFLGCLFFLNYLHINFHKEFVSVQQFRNDTSFVLVVKHSQVLARHSWILFCLRCHVKLQNTHQLRVKPHHFLCQPPVVVSVVHNWDKEGWIGENSPPQDLTSEAPEE